MYSENYSTTIQNGVSSAGNAVAAEALAGLLCPRKTLPAKLFYDAAGCRLFQRITELPEYYLTRTERRLLTAVAPTVAAQSTPGTVLVEYGASDESKAEILLRQSSDRSFIFGAYMPIDIALDGLEQICTRLRSSYPALPVYPTEADFSAPLKLPPTLADKAKLGFFPGSTIGNYEPSAAVNLMRQFRRTLGDGSRLLIGVDLRKDPGVLLSAYNDSAGVTAAFNRNLLVRLNRETGADFDLDTFVHRAIWNDAESRIEMHLISRCDQSVHIAGQRIRFTVGETIHTENSYKYTLDGFTALARRAGWRSRGRWTDDHGRFALHLLERESRAL